MSSSQPPVSILIPNLRFGGAERVAINLAIGLSDLGEQVELVTGSATGEFREQIPSNIKVVDLQQRRMLYTIPKLTIYLRQRNPKALISNLSHANAIAVIATKLSRYRKSVVTVEHTLIKNFENVSVKTKLIVMALRFIYRDKVCVVGVSEAVSRNIESALGFDQGSVRTIYNPIVSEKQKSCFHSSINEPVWLNDGNTSVLLGVGRFTPEKDFATLVRAFAIVRQSRKAGLVLLGDGITRHSLIKLAYELGVRDNIWLPGFVDNPGNLLQKSNVLVHPSAIQEGSPTILVEALAVGCPVVATDTGGGANEVLQNGKYGALTPVGRPDKMGEAIIAILNAEVDREMLRRRAMDFSIEQAAKSYKALIAHC